MRSESPLFQIVSLLMLVGPIYLFWHIDWYWIVGYYNLFFTYSAITLYKSYNRDSNYRRKYHPIIYFGLPLILNFVGFLISLLNGFEEIREDEEIEEKSLKKNISQESQKVNQNVGDEADGLYFNKVKDLEEIKLEWIRGISPIYNFALSEILKHSDLTLCYYKTEEDEFYEGVHISFIVESIPIAKEYIAYIIRENGNIESFRTMDHDRKSYYLGYLFDISIVEPDSFQYPIVEINRRKKLDGYDYSSGEELLHGIHPLSNKISNKIKGFDKLIYNSGEMVADGRYTSGINGKIIDSWHSDFNTAYSDVKKIIIMNDPENQFLKLNTEKAENKIHKSGYGFKSENFDLNFYRGNSSWWVNLKIK